MFQVGSGGLSWNNLVGRLPDAVSKWENLRVLSLGHNRFQGLLPDWILGFESLHMLDLSSNNFSGSLPLDVRLQADKSTIEQLGNKKGYILKL